MKRDLFCLATVVATLLAVGCRHEGSPSPVDNPGETPTFQVDTLAGRQQYQYDLGWGDTVRLAVSYRVVWPHEGLLSEVAERELMYCYFCDSTSASVSEAAKRWVSFAYQVGDEQEFTIIDGADTEAIEPNSFSSLSARCSHDDGLAVFETVWDSYEMGAAHGLNGERHVTIDLTTGQAVHLHDLVDTASLPEVIEWAIDSLEANREVRDCLFDACRHHMPQPADFFIDSTRSRLVVVYSLYQVTPYACGIQHVELPVSLLASRVPLTPLARRLFRLESV